MNENEPERKSLGYSQHELDCLAIGLPPDEKKIVQKTFIEKLAKPVADQQPTKEN